MIEETLDYNKIFIEWMHKNGFNIESESGLKILNSQNETEGRCVISTKDFEPGRVIAKIPHKFMINYRLCLGNKALVAFLEWSKEENSAGYQLTRMDALYLFLIIQKYNIDSDWHGFVNSMPVDYDTPEYMQNELIQAMPDHLRLEVTHRLNAFESKYLSISNLINKFENSDLDILKENLDYSTFKWAFNSVNSRCFHLDEKCLCNEEELNMGNRLFGELKTIKKFSEQIVTYEDYATKTRLKDEFNNNLFCLIPYIDMLNHSFEANAFAYYNEEEKCYVLKSKEKNEDEEDLEEQFLIKENKQVYITYGCHDNKTLLIEYGFVLEDNIYDKINLKNVDFLGHVHEDNNQLWQEAYHQHLLDDLSFNKQDGPSWCLLKFFDLLLRTNKEASELKAVKKIKKNRRSSNTDTSEITSNLDEIKQMFTSILEAYDQSLRISIKKLNEFKLNNKIKSTIQLDTVLRFVNLQLDIVEFNFELVKDHENWICLFWIKFLKFLFLTYL